MNKADEGGVPVSDQHAADEMEKLGHAAMCGNDNPYLSFYSAHPELYRTPIGSWREFYERFARTGDTILIPDRRPKTGVKFSVWPQPSPLLESIVQVF